MKTYELTYIVSSEITAEESKSISEEINSFIQKEEGVILKSENPVAKMLSYPIKKQGSGFFVVLEFQIEPEKLSKIKEKLENYNKILRHFIIIKKPVKPRKERRVKRPSLIKQEKAGAFFGEQKTVLQEKLPPEKEKIELEDIEKKLEEILGQ